MNKFSQTALFTLIALALVACGVQDDRSKKPGSINLPPSCGTDCDTPTDEDGDNDEHDADAALPLADAGQPSGDAGDTTPPDSGNTEPDAGTPGQCADDADCEDGMVCEFGFCVPEGIVPEPKPEPECSDDEDCGSGCWCSNGVCVPDGTDPDTEAPVISDVTISDVTATTVTVSWKTNETASDNHVAYYRFDSDEVQVGFAVTASDGTTHEFTITHLSPSTSYHFYVSGSDAAGNVGESDLATFTTADMPTVPASLPAPFRLDGNTFEFAVYYTNGSGCGEVLGNLPNMTWGFGKYIVDADGDGYLEYTPTANIPDGDYAMSYIDRECTGESSQYWNLDWANYGAPQMLAQMASDDRKWIYCNWYDAEAGHTVTAPDTTGPNGVPDGLPDPGCEVRVTVEDGNVFPSGNMRDAVL